MLPPVFEAAFGHWDVGTYVSGKNLTNVFGMQRYNDPFCLELKDIITNCSGWRFDSNCSQYLKCDTTCVTERYSSTSRRITNCEESVPYPNYPSFPPQPPSFQAPSFQAPSFQGTDILARLVNGSSSSSFYSGRLEVWSNASNSWGTVCDDSFTTINAFVVCKHLGYPTAYVSYESGAYFGEGSGNILMDEVACTGFESNIGQCPHFSSHDCSPSEDVGVMCSSFSPPSPLTDFTFPPFPPWQPSPPPAFCEYDGYKHVVSGQHNTSRFPFPSQRHHGSTVQRLNESHRSDSVSSF